MSRINNEFRLSGRMGSAVEVLRFDNREPIGKVSIAVEMGYRDRDTGNYVEQTVWHDLTFYNPRHTQRLEEHAGKGVEIHVMGSIGKDVFDSKTRTNSDGSAAKDSRVTLIVNALRLGRQPQQQGSAAPAGEPAQAAGRSSGFESWDDDVPF